MNPNINWWELVHNWSYFLRFVCHEKYDLDSLKDLTTTEACLECLDIQITTFILLVHYDQNPTTFDLQSGTFENKSYLTLT